MKYNYLSIYNDFFTKKIPFSLFKTQILDYIKTLHPSDLTSFYDYIIDNSFLEYDPDMVMLTYLFLWLLPNRLNQLERLQYCDNMYISFIKSIKEQYDEDLSKELVTLQDNFNYSIYKRGNIIIMLNTSEFDISIPSIDLLKNKKVFCINCSDEIEIKDFIELYPYGFYILELIK